MVATCRRRSARRELRCRCGQLVGWVARSAPQRSGACGNRASKTTARKDQLAGLQAMCPAQRGGPEPHGAACRRGTCRRRSARREPRCRWWQLVGWVARSAPQRLGCLRQPSLQNHRAERPARGAAGHVPWRSGEVLSLTEQLAVVGLAAEEAQGVGRGVVAWQLVGWVARSAPQRWGACGNPAYENQAAKPAWVEPRGPPASSHAAQVRNPVNASSRSGSAQPARAGASCARGSANDAPRSTRARPNSGCGLQLRLRRSTRRPRTPARAAACPPSTRARRPSGSRGARPACAAISHSDFGRQAPPGPARPGVRLPPAHVHHRLGARPCASAGRTASAAPRRWPRRSAPRGADRAGPRAAPPPAATPSLPACHSSGRS